VELVRYICALSRLVHSQPGNPALDPRIGERCASGPPSGLDRTPSTQAEGERERWERWWGGVGNGDCHTAALLPPKCGRGREVGWRGWLVARYDLGSSGRGGGGVQTEAPHPTPSLHIS
jgi:hypothetical protein